jgi:uncharacterized protein
VSFSNGAVKLFGSLIEAGGTARRPAILFIHGSGAEGRWATRFLAQKFARRGFVSLIFDKRGVGSSTGNWQQSGLEDLAADALAGIDFLKTQVYVDPTRIGIYGHSQGGSVAPLVAERKGAVSFVIASAASGLDPAEAEIYSVENSIGVSRLPATEQPDAKRFVREIVSVAYKGQPREGLDKMEQEFSGRSWYFTPPPKDNYYWTFARRVSGFRPADHWRRVQAPVLLTYGEKDERVPPAASTKAIMGALQAGGNKRVTLKTFPNADHSYHVIGQTAANGWSQRVATYADTLTTWAALQR